MQDLLHTLAVVSAIIVGVFVVHYFQYRTVVAQASAELREPGSHERERLQGEVAALRARVEILERIVTDRGHALRNEIAEL